MTRLPCTVIVIAALLATACAPAQVSPNSDPSRVLVVDANGSVVRQSTLDENAHMTFAFAPDRVWTALIGAYAELGIAPTIADRRTGQYGAVGFLAPRRINNRPLATYFSCGSGITGPLIEDGRVTADVVTTISSAPEGGTLAVTRVSGALRRNDGSSSDPIRCASTGALEEQLRTSVEKQLAVAR